MRRLFTKGFPAALALAAFTLLGSPCIAQVPPNASLELIATVQPLMADFVTPNGPSFAAHGLDNTLAGGAPGINVSDLDFTTGGNGVGTLTIGSATVPATFAIPGGTLQVFTSTSVSNAQAPLGPGNPSLLTSNAQAVVNTSPLPVMITLRISDNNFVVPPSPVNLSASGSGLFTPILGNTNVTGARSTIVAFAAANNVKFNETGLTVENSGVLMAPAGSFNFAYSHNGSLVGPLAFGPAGHSETIGQTFIIPGLTQVTGRQNSELDFGVPGIPEIDPGSAASALACLGSGVLMLAGRRRKQARA